MVLAAMAPGSVFRLLRVEGLPKQREPLELDSVLVCLDTLAVCSARVWRYASQHCCPRHSYDFCPAL